MERSARILLVSFALAVVGVPLLISAAPAARTMTAGDPPVVDDFDRPDENPLSDSGRWGNGIRAGNGESGLKVASNQLACSKSTTCTGWRMDLLYGVDQEAAITIHTMPGVGNQVRVYARVQKPGAADGYQVRLHQNSGTDQVLIERVEGGTIVNLDTVFQDFSAGNKLKIRAVGQIIEAWRFDGSTWTKLSQATDSMYTGVGHVGVGLRGTTGRLDDFAAATLSEPIPDLLPELDDFTRPNGSENPLSGGGTWGNSIRMSGDEFGLKVVSNQLAAVSLTDTAWRSDQQYAADQESWVAIAVKPGDGNQVRVYARVQAPGTTGAAGYMVRYQQNPGIDQVMIERVADGGATIVTLKTAYREFGINDKLRIRAVGSSIQAWRYDGRSWQFLDAATDTAHSGAGYIGVGLRNASGRLDDFGGGNISSPPPPPSSSLLEQYAPELRFHSEETYSPDDAKTATDLHFPDSRAVVLETRRVEPITGAIYYEATASADPNSSLPRLSLDYLATDATDDDRLNQPGSGVTDAANDYNAWIAAHSGDRHHTYGRLTVHPQTGEKYLQYWMYYFYNPKEATLAGVGEHEGDWEVVQLRLSPADVPISVTLSQHRNKETCYWGPSVTLNAEGHAVAYVALDSHANYFRASTFSIDGGASDYTDELGEDRVPGLIDMTTPEGWLLWEGRWGPSGEPFSSPTSPAQQSAWQSPWDWAAGAISCRSTTFAMRSSPGRSKDEPPTAFRQAAEPGSGKPSLPSYLTARLVSGTAFGKAVRVTYCFSAPPQNEWTRPWQIRLTVDNTHDRLMPLSLSWPVRRTCGAVLHPVGGIKPPYVLRYRAESRRGTWSRRAQIAVS